MLPNFHIQISNIFLEVLVIVVETCNQCKVCATAVMVSVNEEFVLHDYMSLTIILPVVYSVISLQPFVRYTFHLNCLFIDRVL